MRVVATLLLVWATTGFGAVGGSILGNAAGKTGLFIGALLGGPLGAALGVWIATRTHWILPPRQRRATIGAIIGFGVAAPIAAMNLHTPIAPVLITSLAGIGAVIGAMIDVEVDVKVERKDAS